MDIFSTLIKFYRLLYRTEIIHDFLEEHTQHHWLPERNNVHFTNRKKPQDTIDRSCIRIIKYFLLSRQI